MATTETTQMPSSLEEVEAVSTIVFIYSYLSEKVLHKGYSQNTASRMPEQVSEAGQHFKLLKLIYKQLILQLYRPGAPANVARTQEALQSLQRSSQGWQIANSFINHQNEQVRFFAALTFIVKLNTDA